MKVKIIKASSPYYWYADKIGRTIDVEENPKPNYGYHDGSGGYIKVEDCELIPEKPTLTPFTFEAWDKDRNQKVWTRDGREVKQLTWFENVEDGYPIVGNVSGKGLRSYSKEGIYTVKSEKRYDLFLEHTEKEYWVNIYTNKDGIKFGTVYDSEQEAKDAFVITEDKYLKTISFKA